MRDCDISDIVPIAESRSAIGKGTNAKPTIKYVMTGTRIDVVSVKGKDELLVVTSFVEKGATVWADAKVTKVKVLSEATKNP